MIRVIALSLLVLPTLVGKTHAAEEWEANYRRCDLTRFVSKDEMSNYADGSGSLVFITPDDIGALERGLVVLRSCAKFWTCVSKRDAGKVKHCYLPKGLHK